MAILNEFGQPFTFAHAADRSMRRGPQFQTRNDDIDRLIPSGDRRTLARGFERALADADQLADLLRTSADRLAQKTALTQAAERAQLWVVTHSQPLADAIAEESGVAPREVIRTDDGTAIRGLSPLGVFDDE